MEGSKTSHRTPYTTLFSFHFFTFLCDTLIATFSFDFKGKDVDLSQNLGQKSGGMPPPPRSYAMVSSPNYAHCNNCCTVYIPFGSKEGCYSILPWSWPLSLLFCSFHDVSPRAEPTESNKQPTFRPQPRPPCRNIITQVHNSLQLICNFCASFVNGRVFGYGCTIVKFFWVCFLQ